MLKHVVLWTIQATDGRSKEENVAEAARRLEGMRGRIPGLLSLEVGTGLSLDHDAWDLVLITTHTDREALAAYQAHPVHQDEAVAFIRGVRERRAVVDFEDHG